MLNRDTFALSSLIRENFAKFLNFGNFMILPNEGKSVDFANSRTFRKLYKSWQSC